MTADSQKWKDRRNKEYIVQILSCMFRALSSAPKYNRDHCAHPLAVALETPELRMLGFQTHSVYSGKEPEVYQVHMLSESHNDLI